MYSRGLDAYPGQGCLAAACRLASMHSRSSPTGKPLALSVCFRENFRRAASGASGLVVGGFQEEARHPAGNAVDRPRSETIAAITVPSKTHLSSPLREEPGP